MINYKDITRAIESILREDLTGYDIQRNPQRNTDPNIAARGKGWIGIYRGPLSYAAHTTGGSPWLVDIRPRVEVQAASMQSGADAEDRLEDAVKDVMDVLTANKKLAGTVAMTNGYEITYEYNTAEQVWHHAALITILAEVRA